MKIFLITILLIVIAGFLASMINKSSISTQKNADNPARLPTAVSDIEMNEQEPQTLLNHGFVQVLEFDKEISVCFHIEEDKPFEIGEKMNEINPDAYMNGHNWQSLLTYYLSENSPKLLTELNHDPEAGMYAAYYPRTEGNRTKAIEFANIIKQLIDNETELYELVKKEGGKINWE